MNIKHSQLVKVQYQNTNNYWKIKTNGPFKIDVEQNQIKPIFKHTYCNWINIENVKYAAYILSNRNLIENNLPQRLWQMYKKMSVFIGTRNFRQCKTQHQKLYQISHSVNGIISYLSCSIQNFQSLLDIQIKRYEIFSISPVTENKNQCSQNIIIDKETIQKNKPQPKTSIQYQQQSHNINKFPDIVQKINTQMPSLIKKQKMQQKWLDCHRSFMQWILKLQQLSEMQKI